MDEELKEEVKVSVTIIKKGEKQSVVQWAFGNVPFRATIANSKVKDGCAKFEDLEKATPYGLDFEEIIESVPSKEDVILAFHNHSVWTGEDVRTHPEWVLSALSSIYSPILRALMQYIQAKKI